MEPEIAVTKKGVKLINFNIQHDMQFDDGTFLKKVSDRNLEFLNQGYLSKVIIETKTVTVSHKITWIQGALRELDKLVMNNFGSGQTLVILVDQSLNTLYNLDKANISEQKASLANIEIIASPLVVTEGIYNSNHFLMLS